MRGAIDGCSLLHAFFGNAAIHLLPLLRDCGVPVVISFHGSDVAGSMASAGYAEAREELFSLAARVPCRSEALAERVAKLGCPRGKLTVMRTMIPETRIALRPPPMGGDWQFVQAARLVPKKGMATALRAFALFAERRTKARFVIAGEGPQEAELRALAASLGVADQVEFAGFLAQEELKRLFARSFAFIHPSETAVGDVEGVPNAMLEAMACGMPVIATRHGGIPEVIENGVNGLLVNEGDFEGLAREMERLACGATLSMSLGEAGARTVREQFSPERQVAAIEAMYREACQGSAVADPSGFRR